jgi:hypothetical protein
MSKKKLLALLIPAVSFLSGVFAQVLLDQWISSRNILLLSIALVIISLITIFIILKYLEARFDGFDSKLMRIANRMGIHVEYVEDGETGKSYLRSADLVEQAQTNLIFVAQWEPFPNYLVEDVDVNKKDGSSRISEARRRFYEALTMQAELHQKDETPFYSRIVQIPGEHMNKRIPFETDQILFEHLTSVTKMNSHAILLRKTPTVINIHFTIIDDRYIIIPILTSIKKVHQARHGAIFFDDPQGNLTRRLKSIYWSIEKYATPIEPDQLELPQAIPSNKIS